ncbi:MAG: helix-turn-helix transcriptional regulator [Roseovarius sp.]|nr:helix-turn-helix transcriptional regulator [Roseovarius sp.]
MLIVGHKLKALRLQAGLSKSKFARLADLDRGTVEKAESGNDVSELTGAKLVNALSASLEADVTIEDLKADA